MNLFSETAIEDIREKQAAWEETELAAALRVMPWPYASMPSPSKPPSTRSLT